MEQEVAQICRASHCIGVSSGSDALLVSLMALDIGPGDEVITTPYTFFATAGAIVRMGAKPVFVDIDPLTFNLDPRGIASKITPRTKAIMPVHLFGQCTDMDPVLDVAKKHKLAVIEDAAQAIGSEYKGLRALDGHGRLLFVLSVEEPRLLRRRRRRSSRRTAPWPTRSASCAGMAPSEILSQGRRRQLPARFHPRRRAAGETRNISTTGRKPANKAAAYYTTALTKYGLGRLIGTPKIMQSRHIFNQYVVRCNEREELREHLKKDKITTEVYYPQPMHLQECFANLGYKKGEFPESERAALTSLALPMYPELPNAQRERSRAQHGGDYEASGQMGRVRRRNRTKPRPAVCQNVSFIHLWTPPPLGE